MSALFIATLANFMCEPDEHLLFHKFSRHHPESAKSAAKITFTIFHISALHVKSRKNMQMQF